MTLTITVRVRTVPAGTAPAGTAQAGTAQAGTAQAGTAQAGMAPAGGAPAAGHPLAVLRGVLPLAEPALLLVAEAAGVGLISKVLLATAFRAGRRLLAD